MHRYVCVHVVSDVTFNSDIYALPEQTTPLTLFGHLCVSLCMCVYVHMCGCCLTRELVLPMQEKHYGKKKMSFLITKYFLDTVLWEDSWLVECH